MNNLHNQFKKENLKKRFKMNPSYQIGIESDFDIEPDRRSSRPSKFKQVRKLCLASERSFYQQLY